MFGLSEDKPGYIELLSGNEAVARGALEAGVSVCASYPGTPSSEIPENLAAVAKKMGIYVQYSVNEKVATEVSAAASFAGLRSMATMKNAGINVASDFLQHHNLSGIGKNGGGMVVVVCDDPGGHSSSDEQDTRWIPRSADIPILMPANVQDAKDLVKWAFEVSEKFKCYCILRSFTRVSHSVGGVKLGKIRRAKKEASYDASETITPETPYIVQLHKQAHERLNKIREVFESSPFNWYEGPSNPELLIVSCGSGTPCSFEAIDLLKLGDRVGLLNLATVWPLPEKLVEAHLIRSKNVLIVEETDAFVEIDVKGIVSDSKKLAGRTEVYGRGTGHVKDYGEITPGAVASALLRIFKKKKVLVDSAYVRRASELSDKMLTERGSIWCAGCPHRASFYAIKNAIKKLKRDAFVIGDVGCYTLDIWPYGFNVTKLLHGMGTGLGLGSGFGILSQFGFNQPVIAVCGDSTFFHSSMPALVNSIYNNANSMVIVLDNGTTAMTGFQPHPGSGFDAVGEPAPVVDIPTFARALGCRVSVMDPFAMRATSNKIIDYLNEEKGVRVLVLRRKCELVRMKEERKRPYKVLVDKEKCKGEECAFCTENFACPGLGFDLSTGKREIVEEICVGCGVCIDICPHKAIERSEGE
jgi:indolepyruvate ferredoxin oxidoreductase alpha subunit